MIKDRFPDDPIPLFLSGPHEETEPLRVRKVVSSELIRKAALVLAAVAIVFAVVSVGNAIRFASVTASQVSAPVPREDSGHSTPANQSTASAEALPGSRVDDEVAAAAFRSAVQNKAEVDRARAEALFNQFQAWAAEKDAFQALPGPERPVKDVRADIVRFPPLPKPRPINIAQTARSQDSSPQDVQSFLRRFLFRN